MGIESSFNDSSVAIVRGNGEILSNHVSSFKDFHSPNAPIEAEKHHSINLPIVFENALRESGKNINEMKAIAVTMGPG